jgi:sugar O-acyltransferase (sialic acid O-acetyltransferase NeuD family)
VVAQQIARHSTRALCFGDAGCAIGDQVDGIEVKFRSLEQAKGHSLVITIGDNAVRHHLQEAAQAAGLMLECVIVDTERYFANPPGVGSQVLAGAVVNPGAEIGAGVIVNSAAVVEHDTHIGDFSHLAPGSVMGGGASVGQGVLLGSNATLLPGVSVASGCVIGAGAVVIKDICEAGTYVGVPARRVKSFEGA